MEPVQPFVVPAKFPSAITACLMLMIAEKNHAGSAKSMESDIAEELFTNTPRHGAKITSYTGDEDSTSPCYVNYRVPYEVTKWSDVQHARRNLGSRLYKAR